MRPKWADPGTGNFVRVAGFEGKLSVLRPGCVVPVSDSPRQKAGFVGDDAIHTPIGEPPHIVRMVDGPCEYLPAGRMGLPQQLKRK